MTTFDYTLDASKPGAATAPISLADADTFTVGFVEVDGGALTTGSLVVERAIDANIGDLGWANLIEGATASTLNNSRRFVGPFDADQAPFVRVRVSTTQAAKKVRVYIALRRRSQG